MSPDVDFVEETDAWMDDSGDRDPVLADSATPIGRRFAVTLVVACLLGAVVNVAMQVKAPEEERGIRGHDDGTLSRLMAEERRAVQRRYLFNAVLHDTIAGGTLVVPDASLVDPFEVVYLGQVDLEVADYDPEIDAMAADRFWALGIEGHGALQRNATPRTFVVVPDSTPAARYRLVFHDDTAFVVPEEMTSGLGS